MANTNFLQFDSDQMNMLNDEDYNSDAQRISGVSSGIARSILYNKQAFQTSTMMRAIANVMVNNGQNAMDNNLTSLTNNLQATFITSGANNTFTGNNTFSGTNTFTGNVIFKDGDLSKWGAYTLGTTPASNTYNQYHLKDANGTVTGAFEQIYNSNGSFYTGMVCKSQNGSTNTFFGIGWDGDGNRTTNMDGEINKFIHGNPRYSGWQTYTKNSSAVGNGYVFLSLRTSTDEDEYDITVNGTHIYKINPRHRSLIPTFIPVTKGDKVNWINASFTDQTKSYFVPCFGG